MLLTGPSPGISVSAMGVIPAHLRTLKGRSYQVAEKEEDDLHEQEDIFLTIGTIRLPFRVKTVKIV